MYAILDLNCYHKADFECSFSQLLIQSWGLHEGND